MRGERFSRLFLFFLECKASALPFFPLPANLKVRTPVLLQDIYEDVE